MLKYVSFKLNYLKIRQPTNSTNKSSGRQSFKVTVYFSCFSHSIFLTFFKVLSKSKIKIDFLKFDTNEFLAIL